jgi:pimeloyl-ACP methyl ester carboxylesterase
LEFPTTSRRQLLGIAAASASAIALPSAARAHSTATHARSGHVRTKDGVDLFVKDWGQGRPIILTHAWPLSSDCWEHQAVAFADAGYRVISYDRRGFGRSSQPSTGYDYDTFADDLAAVIEATGAKDVILAGYSMGGGEIVRYLSRHRSKNVAKVALVATVVPGLSKGRNNPQGVDPAFFDGLKDNLRKDRATFLSGLLKDVFYDVQTSVNSANPVSQAVLDWSMQVAMQASLRALIGSVDAFGKEDFGPDLAAVTMPTLILHGNADKPVPIELTAHRATARIKQAKLVEYAGASHGLLVTERERVTQDLLAWLAA